MFISSPGLFLDYITSSWIHTSDPHFMPQLWQCPFCAIDFDVHGRMESFQ